MNNRYLRRDLDITLDSMFTFNLHEKCKCKPWLSNVEKSTLIYYNNINPYRIIVRRNCKYIEVDGFGQSKRYPFKTSKDAEIVLNALLESYKQSTTAA